MPLVRAIAIPAVEAPDIKVPRSPQSRSKPNDRRRRLGWADSAAR